MALAQTGKATLTGRVVDPSGAVVRDASVQLTPTNLTAVPDRLGEFIFPNVPDGTYNVKILSAGFAEMNQKVVVAAGEPNHLELKMELSVANETVNVEAQSGQSEISAINEELNATNIVSVQSAQEIQSLPNANIADAAGRMAGVSLARDEGEGEYVQVRGLGARFTNVTVDGVTLPASEATVRQINLATIPADMVQAIQVNKTLSANMDSDGIGGSVNLVTRMAGYLPFYSVEAKAGYTPILGGRYLGQIDGVAGQRFLDNKKLGVVVGYSYDYNGRGINDIEPIPILDYYAGPQGSAAQLTPFYSRLEEREYRLDRQRWGTTVGADYKLSDRTTFAGHFIYSNFNDFGERWTYRIPTSYSQVPDVDPINQVPERETGKFKDEERRPSFGLGSLSLTGTHQFNTNWVNGGSAISRARMGDSQGIPYVDFKPMKNLKEEEEGTNGYPGCTYTPSAQYDKYRPQWAQDCMEPFAAVPVFDPTQYYFADVVTTTGQTAQLNLQDWVNAGHTYSIGKNSAVLEYGAEFRNAHKYQNAFTPTYSFDGATPQEIPMSQVLGAFADNDYYNGSYHFGPVTNFNSAMAVYNQNQALFPEQVLETHQDSDPDNFDLIERRSAQYVMNTIEFPRLRIQTGFRLEETQSHGLGYVVNVVGNPSVYSSTTPQYTKLNYIDPLPSLMARYALTDATDVRAVYARGISQPNLTDLVPFIYTNSGSGVPTVSIGNPDIKPTHANNYDLLVEHRLKSVGVIAAGYFYKQLTDPIVTTISYANAVEQIMYGQGRGTTVGQDINASGAHVTGLEFSWRERFAMLPVRFRGLGISANYTYTDSNVEGIPGRVDHPALDGQAKHSFNLQPTYDSKYISLYMGVTFNDRFIQYYQYYFTPGNPAQSTDGPINGPNGDNYVYPHMQVDAQGVARITSHLMFIVNGLNLSNEPYGSYYGNPSYLSQREFYKYSISGSLRWTLTQDEVVHRRRHL